MEEKEKKVLTQKDKWVWAAVLNMLIFFALYSACLIAVMRGAREIGLALLLILLIYLAMEKRLETVRAKTPGENLTAFILLIASLQAGFQLGQAIEKGRLLEALLASLFLLFLFFISWRLGKTIEKKRRIAVHIFPETWQEMRRELPEELSKKRAEIIEGLKKKEEDLGR